MRYDRWYRPWATVFGLGPKFTTIRVADGTLYVRQGRLFRIEVPLKDIKSAQLHRERRRWALGIHGGPHGWLINGSRHGIVELTFARPAKPKGLLPKSSTWLGEPVRSLYLSPADPENFIAAVKPQS
jgi:hypothetical protein